jgi:hypothetical protein
MNGRPANTLYKDDVLLWSEHQRDLLRRLAAAVPNADRPGASRPR